MIGIISTIQHIAIIVLLWLFSFIVVFIIKKNAIKYIKKKKEIKRVKKIAAIVNTIFSTIAIIIIISVVLFLSNPFERTEIKTIKESIVDDSFISTTKDIINQTNKEVIEKKHLEKEEEAEQDNINAMKEAKKLFK